MKGGRARKREVARTKTSASRGGRRKGAAPCVHAEKAMGETSEDDQQPVETDVILSQEEKEKEEGLKTEKVRSMQREKSIVQHDDEPERNRSAEADAPARDTSDDTDDKDNGTNDGIIDAKDTDACLREDTGDASSGAHEDVPATSDEKDDAEDLDAEALEVEDVEAMVNEGENPALDLSLAELVEEILIELGSPPCNEAVIYSVLVECGGLTGFMVKQIIQDNVYFGFVKWKVGKAAPRGFWRRLQIKLGCQRACCFSFR